MPFNHPLFPTWAAHVAAFALPADRSRDAFTDLVAAYHSHGRHYHTLEHVADMLKTIDVLADLASDLVAVRLAAWYHDAVYDPRADDNEERSADLARIALANLGVRQETIERVAHFILATKTHDPADDPDAVVLLDADLAILGAEPERYDRYADAIRREYAWVPELAYRRGRVALLQQFLDRPVLFHTPLRARLDAQARENLRREIARLSAPL